MPLRLAMRRAPVLTCRRVSVIKQIAFSRQGADPVFDKGLSGDDA
jgi:hypothetical protein